MCSIFKLAQGEYISPERIENVYGRHELCAQVFVYGDSLQATLVGVVVPDKDTLMPWAAKEGLAGEKTFEELCADKAVVDAVFKSLAAFGKTTDLKGFECLKRVVLKSEAFSMENNLLTPTFKLKRFEAKGLFEDDIKTMYGEIEAGFKAAAAK
jgi:long-chain acyl-CoA synthetase